MTKKKFSSRKVIWSDIYVVWIEYSSHLKLKEYKIQTTYIRPYYLSEAEIMYIISKIIF